MNTLRGLNDTQRTGQREALQLFDLWRNAQRRAVQGRYDDAVARVYRLLEWTAQWLLRRHLAIDTADVPADRLPAGFGAQPGRDGKITLGLFQAWRLAGTIPGPAVAFVETQLARLQDHVKARNRSILAHGYDPISATEWTRFAGWLQESFMPLLEREAATVGVRSVPEQLPTAQCWRDAGS